MPRVATAGSCWYRFRRGAGGHTMATIPFSTDTDRGEARFFLTMACVMAATILGGFVFNLAMGRSSFALPWVVHFHAWVMMGWIGLYLAQNVLVFGDNIALHRKLGWLSVLLIPAILVMGFAITGWTMRAGGVRRSSTRTSSCSAIRCSSASSRSSPHGRWRSARTPAGTAD